MNRASEHNRGGTFRARLRSTARLLVGVGAVAIAAACSTDQMAGPSADVERRDGLLSGLIGTVTGLLTDVTAILRGTPVSQPIVVSQTFTRSGGELRIPSVGFSLQVPEGAIPGATLTITVTALPGNAVAYDFAPHGTQFRRPLTFRQDLRGTNGLLGLLIRPNLVGGYFRNNSQVNTINGSALVNETLPLRMEGSTATFQINHFSGYLVSTGRSSQRQESNGFDESFE